MNIFKKLFDRLFTRQEKPRQEKPKQSKPKQSKPKKTRSIRSRIKKATQKITSSFRKERKQKQPKVVSDDAVSKVDLIINNKLNKLRSYSTAINDEISRTASIMDDAIIDALNKYGAAEVAKAIEDTPDELFDAALKYHPDPDAYMYDASKWLNSFFNNLGDTMPETQMAVLMDGTSVEYDIETGEIIK